MASETRVSPPAPPSAPTPPAPAPGASAGIARRTWDWVRGKKSASVQSDDRNSAGQKRQKQRIKSKSADIPTVSGESEKENTSPTQPHPRPSSPFTSLSWESSMASRERVQAPTHSDDKATSEEKTQKEEKRRSIRLSSQPKGTVIYTVCGNETLASVAARFDTTITELKKLNKLMTTVIWPGQNLFVPDKEYVPSPPPSPVTPPAASSLSPQGAPASPTTDLPRQAPGLAIPVDGRTKAATGNAPLERSSSEERFKSVEDAITEKFVKVRVKHITDGQGVVSGVLLVTPNAVMFDPNVSDPLVLEHGAERYGLMAPMESILSVAMYHDIAAMKLKTNPQRFAYRLRMDIQASGDALSTKSKVYHKESCPLATNVDAMATDAGSTPDLIKDIPDGPGDRSRTDSTCSCGHDVTMSDPLPKNDDALDVLDKQRNADGKVVVEETGDGEKRESCDESRDVNKSACDQSRDVDRSARDVSVTCSQLEPSDPSQVDSGSSREAPETPESTRQFAKLPVIPEPEELEPCAKTDTEGDERAAEKVLFSLYTEDKSNPTPSESDNSRKLNSNTMVTTNGCLATETSGDNTVATDSASNLDDDGVTIRESALSKEVAKETRQSMKDGTPLVTALTEASQTAQESNKGLLSRTLGSLSSISSFSSTPGFSSLVDYSSGLFARKDSKVKDIHEVDMNSPHSSRNSSSIFYVSVQNNASDSVDKVHVESAVSLEDRPDLFRSLDALMPRPAAQYEDPPLYLCLKLRSAKATCKMTSPIESYTKSVFKPEYWFSIPKEKVDQLYAFFIQWSPSLYDNDEEVDAEGQGFVVVEQESIDIVDDHFNPGHRLSQSWKMVHPEEVADAMAEEDVADAPPRLEDLVVVPELLEPSGILLHDHIIKLGENLPARAEGYAWSLKYSSAKHGISLKTLYRNLKAIEAPVLLVVMDTRNEVFGAMLSCGPRVSDHFYGSGETYLFTFCPEFKTFRWTGANNFYIKGNQESLAIGASEGTYGLWLDSDLYHGRTHFCSTFNNDVLAESEDFVISAVEAWTFI